MLIKLKIQDAPAHPWTEIDFNQGLTSIQGRNGSGKSMVLEMVRYALFGTAALRGSITGYPKTFGVSLEFTVLENSYTVVRNKKSGDVLYVEGNELAVGTKAVNKKVVEVIGYGLDVFDIANCANQDELNALSKMKPTQRLSMVDNVVGLHVIDSLKSWVSQEVGKHQAVADALEPFVSPENLPVKPEAPFQISEDANLEEIQSEYARTISELEAQCVTLQKAIALYEKPLPVVTEEPVWSHKIEPETVQDKARFYRDTVKEYQVIEAELNRIKDPEITEIQAEILLREYETLKKEKEEIQAARRELETKYWQPNMSLKEVLLDIERHQAAPILEAFTQAEKKLQNLKEKSPVVDCPACKTQFALDNKTIAEQEQLVEKLRKDLSSLSPEVLKKPVAGSIFVLNQYKDQWGLLQDYEEKIEGLKTLAAKEEPNPGGEHIPQYVQVQRGLIQLAEKKPELSLKLQELKTALNSDELKNHDWAQIERDLQHYREAKANHTATTKLFLEETEKKKEAKDIIDRFSTFPNVLAEVRQIALRLDKYIWELKNFQEKLDDYTLKAQKHYEASTNLENLKLARDAINDTKVTVKKFLIPSLSRAATKLASIMTDGEFTDVLVDENFDIFVDGKNVNLLSGSGQSVVNLAIRIALGQVLTAKRFSVFMADEIDGNMDAERAEYTQRALRNLQQYIKQILIVSHKPVEADHYVQLGVKRNTLP